MTAERNAAELTALLAEQRRVEHALRISEARFAGIISLAADAIISVDGQGRMTLFNSGAEQIFGYGAQEVLGKPLELLLPERFRGGHPGHLETFRGGSHTSRRMAERQPIFGLRKNGEVEVEGKMVMTAILRDVSIQKQVEAQHRFLARAGESSRWRASRAVAAPSPSPCLKCPAAETPWPPLSC